VPGPEANADASASADAPEAAQGSAGVRRGELVITGESVAVGYLTAAGVQPFATGDGHRAYRTGDVVDHRDGRLYYVERLDRRLKVRGYRLDPGEIESAACRLDGVAEAVVVAESYEADGGTEGDALVCYYQGTAGSRELRAHLEAALDAYKVPSVITAVDAMPYTPNGKVDRAALQALRRAEPADRAALGPREQVLDLVRRLTGTADAALDDNFFDLGGDSASTVVLVGRLKELGWMDAGVRDVLRAERLRDLTDRLPERGA
jgi:acyl-coenzyme A synthetase/AMP-(fatty) acid ligase